MNALTMVAQALRAEAEELAMVGPGALLRGVLRSIAARLERRARQLERVGMKTRREA